MAVIPISVFPHRTGKRLRTARQDGPKQQPLLHRRDAEFTEIGVFLDQELFTWRSQCLGGEFSSGLKLEIWLYDLCVISRLNAYPLQSIEPFRVVR